MRSDLFAATIRGGSVTGLRLRDAAVLVREPAAPHGLSLHRGSTIHRTAASEPSGELRAGQSLTCRYDRFVDLPEAIAEVEYRLDAAAGDLVVRQRAHTAAEGLWGVAWWIAEIPLDYAILVPGGSGLRLSRDTPGGRHQFDYPMTWEAQLVVVQGPAGGFYVWAEDPAGRYKQLIVERRPTGWRLGLVTINDAPFDHLTACDSVPWHLNVYEGDDWRVPARRYRDWHQAHGRPVPVADQQPAWVAQIRAAVIMGLEREVLEALPCRFDPPQTLLYLYDWRAAGYDRNYPDYDHLLPQLEPFLQRARQLGFRVMLHVNYFGLDPLHPLYPQFERYQVREPWGRHDRQWWVWPPEQPDIRFAYINPACQAWRDLFTAAMVRLCRRTAIDALHLDQTLCIYNDHNGRIDGMSMLEGNLALHRELRVALPHVALSGEGLNEITGRYEAFAQRHVWGLDHAKGTYDRRWLAAAHPISSYLLRPYTIMYGYLGCAPPESAELYAAWSEAYRHWGVIPTLKPTCQSLAAPTGFARQFFDELRFWQGRRVAIDPDGPWPADVAFPLRTAAGQPAAATRDRRLVCGAEEISRTVTGVGQVEGDGTIPGWRAFDQRRAIGLDPQRWYPYISQQPAGGGAASAPALPPPVPQPRKGDALHVCRLPEGLSIGYVAELEDMGIVQTRDAAPLVADLVALIEQAVCGTRPAQGRPQERPGPWEGADGAAFGAFGDMLHAHPPWKVAGSGEAFARFRLGVPAEGEVRFLADVALDAGAVGPNRSDGVTFIVRAADGRRELTGQVHNATAGLQALELDLSPFRGREVTLELAVDPGPNRSPSYDWARWHRPRVERRRRGDGTIGIEGGSRWKLALGPGGAAKVQTEAGLQTVRVPVPGAVFFLASPPPTVELPVDLTRRPFRVLYVEDSGEVVASSLHASFGPGTSVVAGVPREGFFAHPPDHGRTIALQSLHLPATAARFETWIGLRDGSQSDGVVFAVEVNGLEVASRRMTPGSWERLDVDLRRWAGQPIVLALVTDSAGGFNFDWAAWGHPRLCP